MGMKMAQKYEFRSIWALNFYYINVVFCIFRICPIMPQSQFIYKTCYIYETHKMAKSLTLRKSAHCFFFREKTRSGKSGKNPDIKFLLFWVRYQEWILQMIVLWCNEIFFFVIYTNYYIFEVTIFSPICTNSKNFREICTFLLFGINISQ